MRALVYHGPGQKSWEGVPHPEITDDTDAIVRVDAVTICGTDLHILKGDVPAVTDGRILGHEAVGTVESVGSGVKTVKPGDRVLVSCITACGTTPTLLRLVTSRQVNAARFVTHHFALADFIEAYDVFARAAETGALKVVLNR